MTNTLTSLHTTAVTIKLALVRILVKNLMTYLMIVVELYVEIMAETREETREGTVVREMVVLDTKSLMVIMVARERPTERVGGGELRCREEDYTRG